MAAGIETDSITHADAFASGTVSGDVACGDLPLEQRLEVLLLASDRPLNESRLVDLLGLMPATPTKPKRKPRTPRPSTDSAESAASPQGEPGELEVAEDPVTAKARKHAISLLHHAIGQLNAAYEASQRAFRVEAIAGGWQMMTLPAFGPLLARLRGERQQSRLSQAAMETLAIVAYRQPILRADLESIRGVACGEVLKSLMDRRLVRIVGRAEEVGRPMLYGTTKEFLRIFGIANLGDLPAGRDAKG